MSGSTIAIHIRGSTIATELLQSTDSRIVKSDIMSGWPHFLSSKVKEAEARPAPPTCHLKHHKKAKTKDKYKRQTASPKDKTQTYCNCTLQIKNTTEKRGRGTTCSSHMSPETEA